ncbi:MAG: hypothetical protein ACE5FJ_02325 [Gemmatimonadales bacterium]
MTAMRNDRVNPGDGHGIIPQSQLDALDPEVQPIECATTIPSTSCARTGFLRIRWEFVAGRVPRGRRARARRGRTSLLFGSFDLVVGGVW